MNTVLIFRERLLAPSETFITEQAKRLNRYRPVLVGLRRTRPSLQYPQSDILLREGDRFIDKLAASLYRKRPMGLNFFRRLRATNASIIHAHFAIDAMQALPIARKLDIPLIVSLHGSDVTSTDRALQVSRSGRHYVQHRERLYGEATAFICVSNFIRDAALRAGFPESKLRVHYTGIDCEQFRPSDILRDPKLILFVGRLVEVKGCEHVIRAMALVQQCHPDAHLEIIGDGPLRPNLEALAAALSIRAKFRGVQSPLEVAQSMARARVLCNPSIKASSGQMEGFGMVFAEAQAVGTPVVSFSHAAIPEVVNHGQTGLLCIEGDIGALADSVQTLLDNSALWTSMSRKGPDWVSERFDISRQTGALELLYDDCVTRYRSAGSPRSESENVGAESPTVSQP
jgi:colanic acid/amylovoran biosynthesis glycosyltransferase